MELRPKLYRTDVLVLETFPAGESDQSSFYLLETSHVRDRKNILIPTDERIWKPQYDYVRKAKLSEDQLAKRLQSWREVSSEAAELRRRIDQLKIRLPASAASKFQ